MTRASRCLALLACLLASGCSGGPENFWRGVTRGVCKFNIQCAGDDRSVTDCAQEGYEVESPEEFGEWCDDYDHAAARECLRYVRTARDGCAGLVESPNDCRDVCGPGMDIVFGPVYLGVEPQTAAVLPIASGD